MSADEDSGGHTPPARDPDFEHLIAGYRKQVDGQSTFEATTADLYADKHGFAIDWPSYWLGMAQAHLTNQSELTQMFIKLSVSLPVYDVQSGNGFLGVLLYHHDAMLAARILHARKELHAALPHTKGTGDRPQDGAA